MAPITEQVVRELAAFAGRKAPVTSLYLDVDGRRHPRRQDYEQQLSLLLRDAKGRGDAEDLRRIEQHVKAGFDRSSVRGLALFSCASDGFWKVFELPVPVRSQVIVNHSPHVRPLEAVLDEYERFAVLLADKQRARVLVFELGVVVDRSEIFDALPRHEDDKGEFDRDHVHDHVEAAAHRHLKRAAHAAFDLYQKNPFDHLLVGAPEEIANELERALHPYLRERIGARVKVAMNASDEEVRHAVLAVEEQVERAKEHATVQRLRDAVGAHDGGVAGLKDTLQALVERRVETLLVSDGYVAEGWRCPDCRFIGPLGRRCPVCGTEMVKVDDVVDEAIAEAVAQSCKVEVCVDNADLDVMGRIGALLRF